MVADKDLEKRDENQSVPGLVLLQVVVFFKLPLECHVS